MAGKLHAALLRSRLVRGLVALVALMMPAVASAQSLIRDAEIEYALRELARPVISAAGLSPARLRILVLNDSTMNAFVADGQTIVIHSGLLLKLSRAEEVQAVLAHEAAHIANGHIVRRLTNMRSARTATGLGMILALAAGAAGSAQAGAGIAAGAAGSANRVFLSHTRAEEASADQSGVRYLSQAGIDPQAAADVLDLFRGQEALSVARQDPYVLSHPLTRERIRAMQGFAAAYKGHSKDDPEADYWFARAQGKLAGFIQNPAYVLRHTSKSDTSDAAQIRRAAAYHRQSKRQPALEAINAVIARRPKDAYAMDLKGQIELESRQFSEAVKTYAKAVELAPKEPLILGGYGRALLAQGGAGNLKTALSVLEKAAARDGQDPALLRDLAVAYAKLGNNGMASLVTAERYAMLGKMKDAGVHAARAAGLLPRGSPGWQRAQDVLSAAETANRSKN